MVFDEGLLERSAQGGSLVLLAIADVRLVATAVMAMMRDVSIVVVRDGVDAVRLLELDRGGQIVVVVADVRLPGISGLELAEREICGDRSLVLVDSGGRDAGHSWPAASSAAPVLARFRTPIDAQALRAVVRASYAANVNVAVPLEVGHA